MNKLRRLIMIALFYAINFGVLELLVKFMSKEWASFGVYLILFPVTLIIFGRQLREETGKFKESVGSYKKFIINILIFFVVDLALTNLILLLDSKYNLNIYPTNNDNVQNQLHAIPTILTAMQTCIFAPVIEEMTFRYSIIGEVRDDNKKVWISLSILAIIMFDVIHIFAFSEFFYYIVPAIILTVFYDKYRNVTASIILHSSINIIGTIYLLI